MGTEKPKQQRETHDEAQRDELRVEQRDLEPNEDQSEKIRGGVLPPNEIRGTYVLPPET